MKTVTIKIVGLTPLIVSNVDAILKKYNLK